MIRPARCAALLGVLVFTACDFHGNDIVIEPEYDLAYSFESGLQDWMPAGVDLTDPVVDWDVSRTDSVASDGGHSVRLHLENLNDQGKVFIERSFDVAPDTAYDVHVTFDFGTADQGDVNLWTILAGATAAEPDSAGALVPRDDTGGGDGTGVTWIPKDYTTRVTSSEDGKLWVHIGVWGTYEVARTYYVDNVKVELWRVSETP